MSHCVLNHVSRVEQFAIGLINPHWNLSHFHLTLRRKLKVEKLTLERTLWRLY